MSGYIDGERVGDSTDVYIRQLRQRLEDYETVLRQIANNATFPAVKAGKVLEKYDE